MTTCCIISDNMSYVKNTILTINASAHLWCSPFPPKTLHTWMTQWMPTLMPLLTWKAPINHKLVVPKFDDKPTQMLYNLQYVNLANFFTTFRECSWGEFPTTSLYSYFQLTLEFPFEKRSKVWGIWLGLYGLIRGHFSTTLQNISTRWAPILASELDMGNDCPEVYVSSGAISLVGNHYSIFLLDNKIFGEKN